MIKKYSCCNNNASIQSNLLDHFEDQLSNSSYHSQTLDIIRSIVDELYQMNSQEMSLTSEQKEKRVRFTLTQETDNTESIDIPTETTSVVNKSSAKYQPMLSESTTVVCCLIEGRTKVDCSVSTHDLPSCQCECATQTTDMAVNLEYSYSLRTSHGLDLHQPKSDRTLSTTTISSKPTISYLPSFSLSLTSHTPVFNHSFYSCEKNELVPSSHTAHQLIIPSKATHYDICQEQTLENYSTFLNPYLDTCSSLTTLTNDGSITKSSERLIPEETIETDLKLCICAKRKQSDTYVSVMKGSLSNQDRRLEELHLSKRSLHLMYKDGLVYIHDLVLVFLRNMSQFDQILLEDYHLSKKQVNLFASVMNQWWEKHQPAFIDIHGK